MNASKYLASGAGMTVVALLAVFAIGCSGDDNSPTGPNPGSAVIYDDITVSLDRLDVKYDCDFNVAGVTNPGEFRYKFFVDTLSDNGSDWIRVSGTHESSASISNGGYKNISNHKASFRFPRNSGQAFRVVMSLREVDPDGNDFNRSHAVTHIYSPSSTQMYAPDGTNYSSWSNATKVGTMSWNINVRDRSWVLGVLTVEGCNATMKYSVTVREVN
jgi:hypothetical protein